MRLVGIVLLVLGSSMYHPIHVSVTNIDLDPDKGKMEISVKLFSDDFQDLIFQKYSVQLQLVDRVKPDDSIEAVNRYLQEALQLEMNGKDLAEPGFVESELNEEATWLFYTYDYGKKIRKVRIRNSLMLEKFDDQTNLVIVSWDGKQNGYRLDNKNQEITFNIK